MGNAQEIGKLELNRAREAYKRQPMMTVEIQLPCECDKYPFAHLHVDSKPIFGASHTKGKGEKGRF